MLNNDKYLLKDNVMEFFLLLVIISMPIWPSYLVIRYDGFPGINLTRILIFILVFLWTLTILVNDAYLLRLSNFFKKYNRLMIYIMVPFFFWKLMTALMSPNLLPSFYSALRDTIFCFFLFLIAVNTWHSYVQIERVVNALIIVSVVVFCISLVEFSLQQNLFSSFVPDEFISAQRIREGLIRNDRYRTWGTFSHPLALGNYCVTVLPIIFWYALTQQNKRKVLGYFVCICLVVTIYMSTSRAALGILVLMMGGFIIFNYFPLWLKRSSFKNSGPKIYLAFCLSLFILLGIWITGQKLTIGRNKMEAGSSSVRLLQLDIGLPLIQQRPFRGYGPGRAAEVLDLPANTVDNYYLSLALESGLPETILFVLNIIYFLFLSWRLQSKLSEYESGLPKAIFWSIVGNILFLAVISLEQILPLMYLQYGILISLELIINKHKSETI